MDLTPEQAKLFERLADLFYERNERWTLITTLTLDNQNYQSQIGDLKAQIIKNADLSDCDADTYFDSNLQIIALYLGIDNLDGDPVVNTSLPSYCMNLTPEQNDLFEKMANLVYRRNVNRDDIARLTAENQALSSEMAVLEAEIIENVDLSVWDVNIYYLNNAYFIHNPHAQDEKILVTFSIYPLLVRPPFDGSDDAPIPF